MFYKYQVDDMDALRDTFENMLEEIDDLKMDLDAADVALVQLYNEANDLEAELNRVRDEYDQLLFDTHEDALEQDRRYNALVADYNTLYDAAVESVHPDFDDGDEVWELYHATGTVN